MMQPAHYPFDDTLLIEAKHQILPKDQVMSRFRQLAEQQQQLKGERKEYIGGLETLSESPPCRDAIVVRARLTAARLLGALYVYIGKPMSSIPPEMEQPVETLGKTLLFYINSKSAIQKFCVASVVMEWAKLDESKVCPQNIKQRLLECLCESIYFDEIASIFTRMQAECKDFISGLKQFGVDLEAQFPPGSVLSLEEAQQLCGPVFDSKKESLKPRQKQLFEDRRKSLVVTVGQAFQEQHCHSCRVQSSHAGCLVLLHSLPEKLNPVIRPLMEALKKEENLELQARVGETLYELLAQLIDRDPCPNSKVIKNLCNMLCSDPSHTPVINSEASEQNSKLKDIADSPNICDSHSGILTLNAQQKIITKPGRKSSMKQPSSSLNIDVDLACLLHAEDENKKQLRIQCRGASLAIRTLGKECKDHLPTKMPHLWSCVTGISSTNSQTNGGTAHPSATNIQDLVHNLQVFQTLGPAVHTSLHKEFLEQLPSLYRCLQNDFTAVRHMASRCIGMLSKLATTETMNCVLEDIIPLMKATQSDIWRQGAIEAIANILEQLGLLIIPYIVLLIVPVLGRMSDQNQAVRLMATNCFATLIRLMPLEV